MTVQDLGKALGYKTLVMPDPAAEVIDGYTSDLLSDVMGNAPEGSVLITIQGHKNSIAVASLLGMQAIILCNNRSAPDDMQAAAQKEGITIFTTTDTQFTASYRVAHLLGKV
ncbi:MAG: iron-sulfur binding hydrogenase [Spirochaetae bacterium HGW-Spirochaetae-8]|jgi:S-adenosylhomocysteine hydrolase|nr:MAG: iron-sulfur binding hydrogenase [Spirochaetae bacterium HGW-Spirochaetae-8]